MTDKSGSISSRLQAQSTVAHLDALLQVRAAPPGPAWQSSALVCEVKARYTACLLQRERKRQGDRERARERAIETAIRVLHRDVCKLRRVDC